MQGSTEIMEIHVKHVHEAYDFFNLGNTCHP
jgi:hypothetical protein